MAACVAVLSLMRTLELEFLQPLPRPILQEMELLTPSNKDLIQSLHQRLRFLMELFDKNRIDGVEAIKELETKLRDVAFRVEDEIEFQIAHLHETEEEFGIGTPQGDADAPSPSFKLGLILQQGMEDIDAVKKELVKIKNEYMLQGTVDVLPISAAHSTQPVSEMVGRDKEFKIIKAMLTNHSSRRTIVSIRGMGGIGKTMLTRRLYEDRLISNYFDVRAWVVASQHHNERQMLLDLLNSLGYTNNSGSDKDLSAQLHKALSRQRYDEGLTTHARSYR
ncbi:disease resistance protein RPP13-like [Ipomoea triloba]|uniref:disease resistance protein RPP13-like n=1 Tax=Ipomoea triloba TaxID=35885 RepID=UPI00125DE307|nr:disease resistance protein RPP13-like [Ipomoea triloba]